MAPTPQERQHQDLMAVSGCRRPVRQNPRSRTTDPRLHLNTSPDTWRARLPANKRNRCSACADILIDQEAAGTKIVLEGSEKETTRHFLKLFSELLGRSSLLVSSVTAIEPTTCAAPRILSWGGGGQASRGASFLVKGPPSKRDLLWQKKRIFNEKIGLSVRGPCKKFGPT